MNDQYAEVALTVWRKRIRDGVAVALTLTIGLGLVATRAERAHAQAQDSPRGYTALVAAGASRVATRELDDRLTSSGHPKFGTRPLAINIGAYRLFRSGLMLGGEWHYLPLGEKQHDGRAVGLGAGYATLGIGYAVELSPRVRFYPRLGLGAGGMGLWSEEGVDGTDVDFEQWLAEPRADPDYSTLSQASMVVDLGAGAELLLSRRRGGPLVGLRLGYVATAFDQGWTRDGHSVIGAPNATVAGPYVRVMIGWRRER